MTPTATEGRKRTRRQHEYLTPPQYAQQIGVNVDKVLGWIRRGELAAINVGRDVNHRPRWAIPPAAREAFELSRSSTASVPVKAIRRRRQPAGITQYF